MFSLKIAEIYFELTKTVFYISTCPILQFLFVRAEKISVISKNKQMRQQFQGKRQFLIVW